MRQLPPARAQPAAAQDRRDRHQAAGDRQLPHERRLQLARDHSIAARKYKERAYARWFQIHNELREVLRLTEALTLRDRVIALLRKQDVTKLRLVLDVALYNGCLLTQIIERVVDVIAHDYGPSGGCSKDDYHLTTMIVRHGGPNLLYACSRALGLTSRSNCYRSHFSAIVQIALAPSIGYLREAVCLNLRADFPPSAKAVRRPRALMADEIALDACVAFYSKFDVCAGYCKEHSSKFGLSAGSTDAMCRLKKAVGQGGETPRLVDAHLRT